MATPYRFPLRILSLILLLVPLLAACTGAPQTPPAAASPAASPSPAGETSASPVGQTPSQPVANVTVTIPYLSQGITSFDHAYWTSQLLVSQGTLFEGLFGYDPQLNVVPKVAESATPSADNKVWTIKLRQDKKWSNGDPVTARDFYAAWIRFMGPELKDTPMWAGMWANIVNAWAFKSGAVPAEEVGVKALDDYTLEISLIQPNAALPNLLAISTSMPINARSLEEHPTDWWDPQHAVFNGPYIVESWINGGDVILARNPQYVGDGIGNVGRIVLRPYQDPNARLQAFENGEIQFTFLEDASQLAYARNVPAMADNMKEELNDLMWYGIQYNRALDAGPLQDQRVRQAFAMAIDKQAITENVLKGMAEPNNTFSADPRVADKITPLPYDVARARELLAEAGYPNGQGFPQLTFYAPPANDPQMPWIEAVVKMWQDNLSVPIVIQNLETPVYNTLQWANYNKDIQPGFATLNGVMNWFQPIDLLLSTGHIWWFMDYQQGGMATYAAYQDQIDQVPNVTEVGDWAELEQRANAAWEKRQQIAQQEDNEWGQLMMTPPTFKEQFDAIAKRFQEAGDDTAKLSAYKDALLLVLKEEQDAAWYDSRTEANLEAQRLITRLNNSTIDESWELIAPMQQMAIDSAWMIPIYTPKLIYTTDPRLSGVVMNKLSWGGVFQFQYLQWNE